MSPQLKNLVMIKYFSLARYCRRLNKLMSLPVIGIERGRPDGHVVVSLLVVLDPVVCRGRLLRREAALKLYVLAFPRVLNFLPVGQDVCNRMKKLTGTNDVSNATEGRKPTGTRSSATERPQSFSQAGDPRRWQVFVEVCLARDRAGRDLSHWYLFIAFHGWHLKLASRWKEKAAFVRPGKLGHDLMFTFVPSLKSSRFSFLRFLWILDKSDTTADVLWQLRILIFLPR